MSRCSSNESHVLSRICRIRLWSELFQVQLRQPRQGYHFLRRRQGYSDDQRDVQGAIRRRVALRYPADCHCRCRECWRGGRLRSRSAGEFRGSICNPRTIWRLIRSRSTVRSIPRWRRSTSQAVAWIRQGQKARQGRDQDLVLPVSTAWSPGVSVIRLIRRNLSLRSPAFVARMSPCGTSLNRSGKSPRDNSLSTSEAARGSSPW